MNQEVQQVSDTAPAADQAAEEAHARQVQTEQNMADAGVPSTTAVYADYFGFDVVETYVLPDGLSYLVLKALNEGDKRKYLNELNREVRIGKVTGDATMKLASGDERAKLLESSITGWNLHRNGVPVTFNENELKKFINKGDPRLFDDIEKAIRKLNPWLTADVTVEDIDLQIKELEELREEKLKEAEGNDN